MSALAQRVKELRRDRGWTAAKLAEEMTAAGFPYSRMTVTKLENGHRSVPLDELFGLSLVLDRPLVDLLVPADDEEPYRVTPAGPVASAAHVREWLAPTSGRYSPARAALPFAIVRNPARYVEAMRLPPGWPERVFAADLGQPDGSDA